MARKDEIEEKVEVSVEEGKKKSPLMLIILVILLLLMLVAVGVGAALYFMKQPSEAEKKKTAPVTAAIGPMWTMDSMIVNLADQGGERYIKVSMQFELNSPEVAKELDLVKPKIKDMAIDLLSSKTYAELADNAGKQRLREELMFKANSIITQGKITKVYFTEFVIQ
ncbi:MAG: flagellar basal body-associated FliL family protein [Syntrophales bacterium]|nr:flagellar basal body-associated FliL family protein [Syntrophales bacterium]